MDEAAARLVRNKYWLSDVVNRLQSRFTTRLYPSLSLADLAEAYRFFVGRSDVRTSQS